MSIWLIRVLITSIAIPLGINAQDTKVAPSKSSGLEFVDQILAGIAVNNDKLGGVELMLQMVDEDLTVTKKESKTIKLPDGGVATLFNNPRSESQGRAVIDGPDFRFDFLTSQRLNRAIIKVEGSPWKEYQSKINMVSHRRPDQLPGSYPLDPRQASGYDLSVTIEDILREYSIQSSQLIKEDSGLIAVDIRNPVNQRFVLHFSPKLSFLPVRSILYHPDGTGIVMVVESEYQRIDSREAWLLDRAVRRSYPKGVARYDEPGWTQVSTTTVVQFKLLEHAEAKQAINALPANVHIDDLTKGEHGPPPPRPAENGSRMWWLLPANVIVVAIVIGLFLFRRGSLR